MKTKKDQTRTRIVQAAAELAREAGPGNISLDAVAARAGVSKGGLLYHFQSKNLLLKAVVEDFLHSFDTALSAEESTSRPNAMLMAYIDHFVRERVCGAVPASGLLAALAEDPSLLDPVRQYERSFLTRIRTNASDPQMATIAFLVLHGIRSMDLLNVQILDAAEAHEVIEELRRRLNPPA